MSTTNGPRNERTEPARTEKPAIIDDAVTLLIRTGAAVAAGHRSRLAGLLPLLEEAEIPREFVRGAIRVGQTVREKPARSVRELTDPLFTDAPAPPSAGGGCSAERLGPGHALDVMMLVGTGAAMAVGCEPCLNQAVPNLLEAGVAGADIRRAAEIGQSIRDELGAVMKEAADLLTGTDFLSGTASELCCDAAGEDRAACCG